MSPGCGFTMPPAIRDHLVERMRDRNLSLDDQAIHLSYSTDAAPCGKPPPKPGAPPFAVFERWEGSNFGEQISAPLQRPAECTASASNSALSYLRRSQADRLLAGRVNRAPR